MCLRYKLLQKLAMPSEVDPRGSGVFVGHSLVDIIERSIRQFFQVDLQI